MNTQEKKDLQDLITHNWFKLLEKIVAEKREELFSSFENLPVGNAEAIQQLSATQNYVKGMKYLIDTAKWKAQDTAKSKDMS